MRQSSTRAIKCTTMQALQGVALQLRSRRRQHRCLEASLSLSHRTTSCSDKAVKKSNFSTRATVPEAFNTTDSARLTGP